MARIAIFLSEGPWQSENCEIFASLAEAALDKGHEVEGFFYMDGVYNAIKHQTFPGGVTVPVERMKRLVEKGAKICACGLSANARGLEYGKEFIEGISVGGLPDMSEMVSEADAFITL
ncbi:MAG: DsrE family protein [Deltaproteobacteria bacterium]|nr:DsrE family protein [Deltaproteobacteria bacterium]MBW2207809.1 DsrE family protein [Deltaproteobacteria bacterium]